MNNKLTALITGASRGIGNALARRLARDTQYGCLILLYKSSTEKMQSLEDELKFSRPDLTVFAFSGDISDFAFVASVQKELSNRGVQPDLIVNNAAISHVGLLIDMTPEEWNQSISVNLTSLYNVCHAFVPGMIQNQAGRIINVSSVWGLVGASCEVAYSASKGAVNAFTKALAKELAPSGIACNAIAFGIVDTDMNAHLSDEDIADIVEDVPASHMLSCEDAAETIVKMSEMPLYVTGDILKCDGGWI